MQVLTKFCKPTCTIMYYESLWNHIAIHQEVFNKLKMTYYIASSMNNSKNSSSISFKRFANFRKNAKTLCKMPKHFTNYELQAADSNPVQLIENVTKWGLTFDHVRVHF